MSVNINSYDIKIIKALMDGVSKKGLCKSKGTTVKQVQYKLDFSESKIRSTLRMFIGMGWVEEGVKFMMTVKTDKDKEKVVAYKTYCVTEAGLEGLEELTMPVKNLEEENNEGYF